jgi:hypothetical protein
MMKPSSKSDEFVTFPRNTNLTTNTSDVIDVSSLALSPMPLPSLYRITLSPPTAEFL